MLHGSTSRSREKGFTLIEVLIVAAIIGVLAAIAVPLFARSLFMTQRLALAADAKGLYSAFIKYNVDNDVFPSTSTPVNRAFNLTTLAPLSNNGYYSSPDSLTRKLTNSRVTAYDSPNLGGSDTQFWAVLTHVQNSGIVILVASTNDYPGHVGTWYDGVYFIQGSSILPVAK